MVVRRRTSKGRQLTNDIAPARRIEGIPVTRSVGGLSRDGGCREIEDQLDDRLDSGLELDFTLLIVFDEGSDACSAGSGELFPSAMPHFGG